MGIPTGARRYHSDKREASRQAAYKVSMQLRAHDPRPRCSACGEPFTPAADGKHYLIGKIPCDWRKEGK